MSMVNAVGQRLAAICPGTEAPTVTWQKDELRDIFKLMDADGNGSISFEELSTAAGQTGMFSEGNLKELYQNADVDQDGKISYAEFVKLLESIEFTPSYRDPFTYRLKPIEFADNTSEFRAEKRKPSRPGGARSGAAPLDPAA